MFTGGLHVSPYIPSSAHSHYSTKCQFISDLHCNGPFQSAQQGGNNTSLFDTRWPTLSDLSSHPLSGSSPSPLSACRNSSDLSPGPFPFSYYKYFLGASTQCHDFKYHLHTDDFYVPSLIRSSPLSNIWISNNFISITELPQKYLKLDKREKGRLGKCEQNGQRPWSAGRGR